MKSTTAAARTEIDGVIHNVQPALNPRGATGVESCFLSYFHRRQARYDSVLTETPRRT